MGRRIEPLISVVFGDFFVRVVVLVRDVPADDPVEATATAEPCAICETAAGLIFHCAACGTLEPQPMGCAQRVSTRCEHCDSPELFAGGPFFLKKREGLLVFLHMAAHRQGACRRCASRRCKQRDGGT